MSKVKGQQMQRGNWVKGQRLKVEREGEGEEGQKLKGKNSKG